MKKKIQLKNCLNLFLIKNCNLLIPEASLKVPSRQTESRGVRNVSICPNFSRTAAIDVLFSFNFSVFFDFIYFRFRPSKSKWIGNVLLNRRNAAIRSMFFFSFLTRTAYWLTESSCVIRRCAAKKIWEIKFGNYRRCKFGPHFLLASIYSRRDILWTFGTFPTPLLSRYRLPLKDLQTTGEAFSSKKRYIQHLKTWNLLTFSIFVGHFYPSGSRFRIHNTDEKMNFLAYRREI